MGEDRESFAGDSEAMLPDIVVSNSDDRETVLAALMIYAGRTIQRGFLGADVDHVIRELAIASRLMRALRDQDATDAAGQAFTDSHIAEFMQKIQDRYGDSPDGS